MVGVAALALAACTSDPILDPSSIGVPPGSVWYTLLDFGALPVLGRTQYRLFSSYDRSEEARYPLVPAGDKDFNNFLAVCGSRPAVLFQEVVEPTPCEPGREGYLIAADDGPGFVARMLYAGGVINANALFSPTAGGERLRVFVDDRPDPAYDVALSDWVSGTAAPFSAPLTRYTSGAQISYLPIPYTSKLRVFLDGLTPAASYYYQVDVQSHGAPVAEARPSEVPQLAPLVERLVTRVRNPPDAASWLDETRVLEQGEAFPLLDRAGPGTLARLSLSIDGATVATLQAFQLTARWDTDAAPAIDLPLSSLFAAEQALSSFETLPMVVHTNASWTELSLYLPMPFAAHAQVTLTNRGPIPHSVHASLSGLDSVREGELGTLRMTAQRAVGPFAPGDDYPLATLRGRGKYVGTILFMTGQSDSSWVLKAPLNFLEGDPTIIADGTLLHGTGTEEYSNAGVYFLMGTFDSLFAAVPFVAQNPTAQTGQATMVRWHILDSAIDFQNTFDFHWEYGPNNPQTALDYQSVAIYYQK